MSTDDISEKLKQVIEEHVINQSHEPVAIPEGVRLHVNSFGKKGANN